jgi:hypothetical protein
MRRDEGSGSGSGGGGGGVVFAAEGAAVKKMDQQAAEALGRYRCRRGGQWSVAKGLRCRSKAQVELNSKYLR